MNKKVSYSKLLTKFDSLFNKGFNTEDRQFFAKISKDKRTKGIDPQNININSSGQVGVSNERNLKGDVIGVNTEDSAFTFSIEDLNKNVKLSTKTTQQMLELDVSKKHTKQDTDNQKKIIHTFGLKWKSDIGLLWYDCKNCDWDFYIKGDYRKSCFNELKVGYKGKCCEPSDDDIEGQCSKIACAVPNRVCYNHSHFFKQNFFGGANLVYSLEDQKPKTFEQIFGYAKDNMMLFGKHASKGWFHENSTFTVGGMCNVKRQSYRNDMFERYGFGLQFNAETKKPTLSLAARFSDGKSTGYPFRIKVKQENFMSYGSITYPIDRCLSFTMSESANILNFVKNPRDGASHDYNFGVSLSYKFNPSSQ